MNVSRISMAKMPVNFRGINKLTKEPEIKHLDETKKQDSDDAIVGYGTWGGDYIYPITASQIRKAKLEREKAEEAIQQKPVDRETPEEYYKRKLYSTEWCT